MGVQLTIRSDHLKRFGCNVTTRKKEGNKMFESRKSLSKLFSIWFLIYIFKCCKCSDKKCRREFEVHTKCMKHKYAMQEHRSTTVP